MTTDTTHVDEVLSWDWRHGEMARGGTGTSYYPMIEQLTQEEALARAAKLEALGIEARVHNNHVGHAEGEQMVHHDDFRLEVRGRESVQALAGLGCPVAEQSVASRTAPMHDYYRPNSAHR